MTPSVRFLFRVDGILLSAMAWICRIQTTGAHGLWLKRTWGDRVMKLHNPGQGRRRVRAGLGEMLSRGGQKATHWDPSNVA